MSILTPDKITEIFCIADDFCKKLEASHLETPFWVNDSKKHRNRSCMMSDSEIITILVCFHFGSFRNFKHYQIEHFRHRGTVLMNLLTAITAYCFFDKRPAIKFDRQDSDGQLDLFTKTYILTDLDGMTGGDALPKISIKN